MSLALTFRPGRPEDGEALLILHQRSIRELGRVFYATELLESWAYGLTAERYGACMAEEAYDIACLPEGKIVGFCATKDNEVKGLSVDPDMARRRVGSMLLKRAVARLRERNGKATLRLTASLAGVDFYRHHGWQEVRRWLDTSRGGLLMEAVEMELPFHPR